MAINTASIFYGGINEHNLLLTYDGIPADVAELKSKILSK
jgi:hypothetical protein